MESLLNTVLVQKSHALVLSAYRKDLKKCIFYDIVQKNLDKGRSKKVQIVQFHKIYIDFLWKSAL